MGATGNIRAAAAQLPAFRLDQADQSWTAIEAAVRQAAAAGAELLVLPECAYPAYLIGSVEAYRAAHILRPQEFIIKLARLARKSRLHVVAGYIEDAGTHLYNAAVLIDAAGQEVGSYRKSFLWAADNRCFKPGERVPCFDTVLGRLGIVICADTRAPEIIARLIMGGAQLVAMPTCWVNVARQPESYENPQPEFLISARSREFEVPFVCANKFGMESEKIGYCGRSIIADRGGRLMAEAPGNAPAVLVQDVQLREQQAVHEHDELWESLLTWKKAVYPQPQTTDTVTIAVWPGEPISAESFKWAAEQDARLLVANGLVDDRVVLGDDVEVLLPAHIGAIRELAVGRVACMKGADLAYFGRTRLFALAGAEIVCVFDPPDDVKLLRTRAVENRIFILAVGREMGAVVAPDGEVLGYASVEDDEGLVVEVRIADASNKLVAPDTDIWEQRRVATYR